MSEGGTEDFITILTSADGKTLTKRHTPAGTIPYDKGFLFRSREVPIDSLEDLAAALECSSKECVILGRAKPGIDRQKPHRRVKLVQKDGAQPNYDPAPHSYVVIDYDEKETPVTWLRGILGTVQRVISGLPPEFHEVDLCWRLTSSSGIAPGIRLRLTFMLDRPVSDGERKAWFAGVQHVDASVFDPVQPIYCAAPVFEGVPDPIKGPRSGIIRGSKRRATPPGDLAARAPATTGGAVVGFDLPEGMDEDDDAELDAELRVIAENYDAKNGMGEAPSGYHVYRLACLLGDKCNGTHVAGAAKIIAIMQGAGYGDIDDSVFDRRKIARGCEQIHSHEYPEPSGDMAEKFGRIIRVEKAKAGDFSQLRPDDVVGYQDATPILAGNLTLAQLIARYGVAPAASDTGGAEPKKDIPSTVKLSRGRQFNVRRIEWLWDGWLALGKYHVLAGPKGAGKSTLGYSLMATISVGGRWPDGSVAPTGDSLVWSAEDDFEDTILPRFIAAGGDPDRLIRIGPAIDENGCPRAFDPSRDIAKLRAAINDFPDARMLMIDPIVMAVSGDSHKNAETRQGLQPLVDLAEHCRLALIGITHFTKGTDGKDPVERVTGSLAFGALARVVLAAQASEDSKDRRLVRAASNIGPSGGGFAYRLEQRLIEDDGGGWISAQRVDWGDELHGAAKELLENARNAGARGKATDWLTDMLAGGPVNVSDLRAAAGANGHSWPTIERAKAGMPQIVAKRRPELHWGRAAPWCWQDTSVIEASPDMQPNGQ